jgi:hypothetical protein
MTCCAWPAIADASKTAPASVKRRELVTIGCKAFARIPIMWR